MDKKRKKNPHAMALGKLGGKRRAEVLTPERRREISKKALDTRWAKVRAARQKKEEGNA